MRPISDALAAKVRELIQTKGNDADPKLSAIVSRHVIPITDYSMWQTEEIGAIDATRVSIAAERPDAKKRTTKLYIAAIRDGVGAALYSADFDGWRPPVDWNTAGTVSGATDVALAFEGEFTTVGRRVEFATSGDPWVFWIDASGDVRGKRITEDGAGTALGGSAAAEGAIMGPAGYKGGVSAGLVMAWVTTSGAVMTRQYASGAWEDAVLCSDAPANVVDVSLARTWDYRVAMTLKTSDGKVYLMASKSMISGNSNNAFIDVPAVSMSLEDNEATYRYANDDERIEIAGVDIGAEIYPTTAPVMVSANNIDDGTGNWGIKLRVVFDAAVYDISGSAAAFTLAGSYTSGVIAYDPEDPSLRTIILTMSDFNNAPGSTTLAYAPGTLASGPSVTLVEAQSIAVTLTGLAPSAAPGVTGAEVVDNITIDLTFDGALSSTDISANAAAFAVTGEEPAYSPGGENVPTTYTVDDVEFAPSAEGSVAVDLASGDMDNMEVV